MERDAPVFVDSHIHLSHHAFDGCFPYLGYDGAAVVPEKQGSRDQLLRSMREAGVRFCVEPAIGPESNAKLLALAARSGGFILPAVGLHPTRIFRSGAAGADGKRSGKRPMRGVYAEIRRLAASESVVAIGETGLDYFLPRREQHRAAQFVWFIRLLRLADREKLPVILHVREADRDALLILRLMKGRLHGGVCHCFRGTPESARRYRALGLKLGIGASLLQGGKMGCELERVVRETPLEDLLLETDGPYVKPPCPSLSAKQLKKARNTSLILPAVAERIAELKGLSAEEVARVTAANAAALFCARRRGS